MAEAAEQRDRSHGEARARQVDLTTFVAALLAVVAAWLLRHSAAEWLAIAAASALATYAALRPWCRRHTRRSVESATWSSTRERQHAIASAATHAEQWRAIVDTATEGIVTIDAAGTIETVNGAAERMFGHMASELVGKNVKCLMPPPYRGEHDGYLERYLRTGERRIIGIGREVVGLRKDGGTFPIDLSVGEGVIEERRFFTALIRDITEQKVLQTKLAQAERLAAVGELAAGVAHEINNPINTMINCAQLIRDGDDPESNSQVLLEEGERIADIVRDLLQFARDDRAQAHPTSLSEAAQRTRRLIGENWKRHGITLIIDVAEDLPPVHARPQQIQQVLLNLLINAKDALTQARCEERRVTVTARANDNGVELAIIDSGPGIDPDVIDRIFEPFVTTKRGRGGTGLGLSISKSIIESYNGTLMATSKQGHGATFTVWLPISGPDER